VEKISNSREPRRGDNVMVPNGEEKPIFGTIENIDVDSKVAIIKLEGYGYRVSIPVVAVTQILV